MNSVVVSYDRGRHILAHFNDAVVLQKKRMKESAIADYITKKGKSHHITREEAIQSLSPSKTYEGWIIPDFRVFEYERKFIEQLRCLLLLRTETITIDGETAVALEKFL